MINKTGFCAFLFLVTTYARADVSTCGMTGSIADRIRDCKTSKTSSTGNQFSLVTRDEQGQETWQDGASKLVWYPKINKPPFNGQYDWGRGNAICLRKELRLPTIAEFKEAETRHFREVVPFAADDGNWWSSTRYSSDFPWSFDSRDATVGYMYREYRNAVRCVGSSDRARDGEQNLGTFPLQISPAPWEPNENKLNVGTPKADVAYADFTYEAQDTVKYRFNPGSGQYFHCDSDKLGRAFEITEMKSSGEVLKTTNLQLGETAEFTSGLKYSVRFKVSNLIGSHCEYMTTSFLTFKN